MEYKTIRLADVLPSETNPREDFGDLEALAASFDYGPYPGEPVQPITVVADGDRWRIYDGERRYRAMLERGTLTCHANVCEDMDEADMLTMAMVTDDKKRLTDAEKDRGVQRMLLLGVAPEKVDRAARVTGAASAKRGYGMVDDAALLTFEQAKVLEGFEGDDEAVAELVALAGKSTFDSKAREMGHRREVLDLRAALSAALDALKVRRADERPDGSEMCCTERDPEKIPASYMAAAADHTGVVAVLKEGAWTQYWADKPYVAFYGEPMDGAADEEDAAQRAEDELVDRLLDAWPDETVAHDLWFEGKLGAIAADPVAFARANPALGELVTAAWKLDADYSLERFHEATEYEVGQRAGGIVADMGLAGWIIGWVEAKPGPVGEYAMRRVVRGEGLGSWDKSAVSGYAGWLGALIAAGYIASAAEAELLSTCKAYLAAAEEGSDE